MNAPQPPRSLKEKSSARLVAAQLLYQADIMDDTRPAAKRIADYQQWADDNKEAPKEVKLPAVPPHYGYLSKLLEGVEDHQETLEPWVDKAILSGWVKERMSPLLLAILRLAIYELAEQRQLKAPIIISEYVSLSARFFSEAETGFINAALASVVDGLRDEG